MPPAEPARLHGDLWAGNVLWSASGPVLVDPAAHGGHRETDLAMLALFGLPHLDRVLAAYDEAWPLDDGWRDRVALHQLHPLLVHAALFGGGYGRQAVSAAAAYADVQVTSQGLREPRPPARQWSSERGGRWLLERRGAGSRWRARPACGCSCSAPRSRRPPVRTPACTSPPAGR